MPAGQQPIPLPVPVGGVRGDVMPYDIPKGYLWRANNVVDFFGKITTRPGYVPVTAAAPDTSPVIGGITYRDVNGVFQTIAATLLNWWLFNGATWTKITGAQVFTADQDNPWRFTAFPQGGKNWALGVDNKSDGVFKFDSGAATLVSVGGAPPAGARDITTISNYVCLFNTIEGGSRFTSRIRLSDFNNMDVWPTTFNFDLAKTGDNGVGCRALTRQQVLFYKDDSVWIGSEQAGTFPIALDVLSQGKGMGPVSPSAIVADDQYHYYLGQDMVLRRASLLGVEAISDPIDPFLQVNGLATTFRTTSSSRVWGMRNPYDKRLWWFYPGTTSANPNLAISYHIATGAWHLHTYTLAMTAGWEGDVVAIISWDDLASFTWDTIAATYPTWDSLGGAAVYTAFLGDVNGQVHRQRYTLGDNGAAIAASFEFPLRPWVGFENMQQLDGIDSLFDQITGGPLVTVQVGESDALAELVDPAYTTLTNLDSGAAGHDTTRTARQKLQVQGGRKARFMSMKYSWSYAGAVNFKGGEGYMNSEAMP